MQTNELRQGNSLMHHSFAIAKDGVVVTQKDMASTDRFHVYFETIPPKAREMSSSIKGIAVLAMILSVIALLALIAIIADYNWKRSWGWATFWVVAPLVCWWCFFKFRREFLIYSQDGGGVMLRANKPTKAAVQQFVQEMFRARNDHLKAKYTRFASEEPVVQRISKLNYLLAQEAITESEFDDLCKQFTSGLTPANRPVGFAS